MRRILIKQKSKDSTKRDLRELIVYAYEDMLRDLSKNKYGDETTEHLPVVKTQDEKFDILKTILVLNLRIVDEVIQRYLYDVDITAKFHRLTKHGIDSYKQAGFLTFWVAKLKPIMITGDLPEYFEIGEIGDIMFVNEVLAIGIASSILANKHNAWPPINKKLNDDLKYTLRYRIITRHESSIMYESLCRFFTYPTESRFLIAK